MLVIGDNEARPHYLQLADLRCVGHVCSLMFYCCRNLTDVCLLKQGGSRYLPPPTRPGSILENNFARYVVRNQAETAEDAESTGEHHRRARDFPVLPSLCGVRRFHLVVQ